MPDYRKHQAIAERADIDFNKRPDPARVRRGRWMWLCALAGLWPVAWWLGTGDETVYWAHTVSVAHQRIAHDCKACHAVPFQSVSLLFSGNQRTRRIEAKTCQTCHLEDVRDHNPDMVVGLVNSCFECHQDHRRKDELAWVSDIYCINCHNELEVQQTEQALQPSDSFATHVPSFRDHPEFGVRRKWPSQEAVESSRHKMKTVAMWTGETVADKSEIKFNHARHLQEAGLPITADHPANKGRQKPLESLKMTCADCHTMDADGRYMQPINYERHCADCHALNFTQKLHQIDIDTTGPLPHESPEIIRGTLRDRLTAYIEKHPEKLADDRRAADNPLPQKATDKPPTPKEKAAWVDAHLADLEATVQGNNRALKYPTIMRGCQHCHTVEVEPEKSGVNWKIKPPNIPERWLPHSKFSHAKHDINPLRCADCHYKQRPDNSLDYQPRKDEGSIYFSKTAKDVLMPSITVCRDCHSPASQRIGETSARHECVECHLYHHTDAMTDEIRLYWDKVDGSDDVLRRVWSQSRDEPSAP